MFDAAIERLFGRGHWHSKFAYCGMFFGFASLFPFYSVLLVSKGFGAAAIGWLASVQPGSTVLVLPPVAFIADKLGNSTAMALVAAALTVATAAVMTVATDPAVVATATVAHFIVVTPLGPLLDKHTMALLPADEKAAWGGQRVFGAYGWGVGAPLAAVVIGAAGFASVLPMLAGGLLVVAWGMVRTPTSEPRTTRRFRDVGLIVVRDLRMVLFLCCVVLMGMGYVFIATYLFVFLQEELGAPKILLGLSITCTVLVEVPLFNSSEWLHRQLSDKQLMAGAMVVWAVRVVGYSMLSNPWMVLLLEPLHGATFGMMWLGSVHFFSTRFPADLSSSSFGVLHATAFGLGPMVGNVVGGHLYDAQGPRFMFRSAAVVMLCACGVYVALDGWAEARERRLCEGVNAGAAMCGRLESPRHPQVSDKLPESGEAAAPAAAPAENPGEALVLSEGHLFETVA